MAVNMAQQQSQRIRNDPNLARFRVEGTATGKQLGNGPYGSVEEIMVDGLICAGKKIHEVLIHADNEGTRYIAANFVQECQIMADLRHPHVALFLGVCFLDDSSLPVLVMEKLDCSLDDLLENVANIPLALKRSMLEDVARGLLYLHKHNIIHRDLTASNVLLTTSLVAKIADFGSSCLADLQPGELACTLSRLPGNALYMPPEALRASSRYGPSLDIFSFGHLALFVGLQVFPWNLLHPVCPDPRDPFVLLARNEVERRGIYIDQLKNVLPGGSGQQLFQLIKHCLHNMPSLRPTAEQLVTTLESIKASIEGPYGELAMVDAVRHVRTIKILKAQSDDMANELQTRDHLIAQLQEELQAAKEGHGTQLVSHADEQKDKHEIKGKTPQKGHLFDLNNWDLERESESGEPVVLGNGNFGKVYKGYCRNSGKHLAIKVVLDLNKKAVSALEKEVKHLSGLKPHMRIVMYLGACYADHPRFNEKCLYVFTEFMPGGTLSSCLEQRGRFTETLTQRYTYQILEGVMYLHDCHVIHCDIKGSNIMCDTSGNVKLADFGSAKKIRSESLSKSSTFTSVCGTAPWMAPELFHGMKAQTHSDIWSVAATVVEMLTGAMPYESEKFERVESIMFKVGSYQLDPLKSMKNCGQQELLTPEVEDFLSKCFNREPKERPSATTLLTTSPFCTCLE